jgi:hypothetical protein
VANLHELGSGGDVLVAILDDLGEYLGVDGSSHQDTARGGYAKEEDYVKEPWAHGGCQGGGGGCHGGGSGCCGGGHEFLARGIRLSANGRSQFSCKAQL